MTGADAGQRENEQDAVMRVVKKFSRSFDNFDTNAFMSTWDADAANIVYQPEELRYAIFDMEGLRVYFDNLPNVIRRFHDVKVLDLKLTIDEDFATVYVRFWCRIAFARVPETADGQIRQSFVLRKRNDTWRILHYHESRQAAGMEAAVGQW
jgi:ketosteroid isomerase-like protein